MVNLVVSNFYSNFNFLTASTELLCCILCVVAFWWSKQLLNLLNFMIFDIWKFLHQIITYCGINIIANHANNAKRDACWYHDLEKPNSRIAMIHNTINIHIQTNVLNVIQGKKTLQIFVKIIIQLLYFLHKLLSKSHGFRIPYEKILIFKCWKFCVFAPISHYCMWLMSWFAEIHRFWEKIVNSKDLKNQKNTLWNV